MHICLYILWLWLACVDEVHTRSLHIKHEITTGCLTGKPLYSGDYYWCWGIASIRLPPSGLFSIIHANTGRSRRESPASGKTVQMHKMMKIKLKYMAVCTHYFADVCYSNALTHFGETWMKHHRSSWVTLCVRVLHFRLGYERYWTCSRYLLQILWISSVSAFPCVWQQCADLTWQPPGSSDKRSALTNHLRTLSKSFPAAAIFLPQNCRSTETDILGICPYPAHIGSFALMESVWTWAGRHAVTSSIFIEETGWDTGADITDDDISLYFHTDLTVWKMLN